MTSLFVVLGIEANTTPEGKDIVAIYDEFELAEEYVKDRNVKNIYYDRFDIEEHQLNPTI